LFVAQGFIFLVSLKMPFFVIRRNSQCIFSGRGSRKRMKMVYRIKRLEIIGLKVILKLLEVVA